MVSDEELDRLISEAARAEPDAWLCEEHDAGCSCSPCEARRTPISRAASDGDK
jgi:hypothetical protein